ncbi:MAG: DUF3473 domain-containing protein [Planctomycetota bacterium]
MAPAEIGAARAKAPPASANRNQDAGAIVNAMTIDVEDYFQVGVFQDRIRPDEWDRFDCRVEHNLDRCLAILEEGGVRATFFTLGWVAERYPAAIRRLAELGHEVASHGYGHRPIWQLDREAYREDIRRSQGVLGEVLGAAPTAYRAPCFSVRRDTLWALDCLFEEGIRVDSSIFPVGHPEYGIPDAETRIHRIALADGELVEFPMTVGSLLGKKAAFCGGGWFRLFPYALTRRSLAGSNRKGEPFVFYLHPWELDPDQPRLDDRATATGRFRHYVNLARNPAKFARLVSEFRFGTLGEAIEDRIARTGELPLVRFAEI